VSKSCQRNPENLENFGEIEVRIFVREQKSFEEEQKRFSEDNFGMTPISPMLPPSLIPAPGPRPPNSNGR
jgi:hypothetical protein